MAEAVDAIARAQGDDCDAVGDLRGAGGRKGDVVVDIDGCAGPPRGRIVFEAKNAYVPKNKALAELDAAMEQRDADYGVWVVPGGRPAARPRRAAARGQRRQAVRRLRPRGRLAARARGRLLAGPRADADGRRRRATGSTRAALRTEVERALAAMDDVRRIKSQLTQATGGIDGARRILDEMADRVRGHLVRVDALVIAGHRRRPAAAGHAGLRRPPGGAPGVAQLDRRAHPQHGAAVDPRRERDQQQRRRRSSPRRRRRSRPALGLAERDPRRHGHRRDRRDERRDLGQRPSGSHAPNETAPRTTSVA